MRVAQHFPLAIGVLFLCPILGAQQQPNLGTPSTPAAIVASPTQWTSIGPLTADLHSVSGSWSGLALNLVVDPRDRNTVYLGSAGGGVWKTTDGGLHWNPLTDTQPSLFAGPIELDPTNPDVVYVGTGNIDPSLPSGHYGAGILKSTDGGITWRHLPGPFVGPLSASQGGAIIYSLAVHPTDGQTLLAGIQGGGSVASGIYRSTDGGITWASVLAGGIGTGVLFNSSNGNISYAALSFGTSGNGVYKSSDAGLTWTRLSGAGGNVLPTANLSRIQMAIAPSNPLVLYVGISNPDQSLLGLFKTTDGGLNWAQLSNAPDYCGSTAVGGVCGGSRNVIQVHPANADVVFVGGRSAPGNALYRTLDGGSTWVEISRGADGLVLHSDLHAVAFSSDGAKLYVGNDGGVYSTADVLASSVTWRNLNATLAIAQFSPGFAIHPTDVGIVIGAARDLGLIKYAGNLIWDQLGINDGAGRAAIDPTNPSIVYGSSEEHISALGGVANTRIHKSRSGGNRGTWVLADNGIELSDRVLHESQGAPPFVMDPSNPQRLYFGTYRVYQTNDGADSWTAISPDLTGGSSAVLSAIAVAPSDSNTVYVGSSDGHIQVTTNAGAGAGAVWTDRTGSLPRRLVSQITIDSSNRLVAYVTFSGFFGFSGDIQGHVFKTTNGGLSWTDISGNLPNVPVNDVVIDPDLPNTLYIGTNIAVFATVDGGGTWSPLGSGLPRTAVTGLKLDEPSRILRAGTEGRGMWDLQVPITGIALGPSLISLSPSSTAAGGAGFSLTVNGANFTPGLVVRWNGSDRPTTFFNSAQLTASISASDIGAIGTAQVAVFDPASGTDTGNALAFFIIPPRLAFNLALTPNSGQYQNAPPGSALPNALVAKAQDLLGNPRAGIRVTFTVTLGGGSVTPVSALTDANGLASTRLTLGATGGLNVVAVTADGAAPTAFLEGGGDRSTVTLRYLSTAGNNQTGVANSPLPRQLSLTVTDTALNPIPSLSVTWQVTAGGGLILPVSPVTDSNGLAAATWVLGPSGGTQTATVRVLNFNPATFSATARGLGPSDTRNFAITDRAVAGATSSGDSASVTVGYGRIQPNSGYTAPAGLAIFGFRTNNVLVSEAAVPASPKILSGRIYAEVSGPVNTGLAIANPNNSTATIAFFFSNASGDLGAGTTTVPPNGQIATFLDQAPFNSPAGFQGTFSFTSNVPVGVVALRGFTNQRGDFLITTLPVIDPTATPNSGAVLLPHFADGGGWTTQIFLVNPTDTPQKGTVQFANPTGGTANVTVGGQSGSTFPYSVPARTSQKLVTAGSASTTTSGSIRIVPDGAGATPTPLVVFSYKSAGITVSEAGVPSIAGTAFRMYAESSGATGQTGNIQTGIAIANTASTPATVTFDLTRLDGSSTGLTASLNLPGSGQIPKFLTDIFPTLPSPFQGLLRITTNSAGISIVGLRGRYNERGDFLITTTSPANEAAAGSTAEMLFPHIADGGGYTTQFILFSGFAGQSTSGTLRFFSQSSQPLNLTLR